MCNGLKIILFPGVSINMSEYQIFANNITIIRRRWRIFWEMSRGTGSPRSQRNTCNTHGLNVIFILHP